ncbi:circularly permuted type 2 ATP-grasp protein [Stratiformator vulcanicus]|uniref:Uncharacterized protein n=1 Tax=Stratiformator vulcanicus TaxID=2527980 RepID=A0A517QX10_9PLAN|nr:circularly permuted type 2 ATP-grasp protein [Stratiformator vulcanicus]QDT36202.1 hypothetical protein Pan189_05570 [Stratiformator vulcanicus]
MTEQRQTQAASSAPADAASPEALSSPPPVPLSNSNPATAASALSAYRAPAGRYDEMIDNAGHIRSAWTGFRSIVDRLGERVLSRRWDRSQRLIYENGITFAAYGDPSDTPRPWRVDALPILVGEDEWGAIAEGLKQRARLMSALLADLYGPRTILAAGVMPAEAIYRNPGYRLPYHAHLNAESNWLPFFSSDLGRSPDGRWWVLADRTEAASGLGFALENRIVVSRMLPEPFRDCQVQRLASFFMNMRKTLGELAPRNRENPRVVLLTNGPSHRNYFEDAYLARYLGYPLAEGGDLTVRGDAVYLKTLDGLRMVDVIFRRPTSHDCDPLELGGNSSSGIAGLLSAVRRGGVSVANPLGSGLVESPAIMAFLPRLCRFLFGEELKLPGVASWWCGEAASKDYVLKNLDRLDIKPAFRLRGRDASLIEEIKHLDKAALAERIKAEPTAFVAQEKVDRSTAPLWNANSITPTRIAVRTYLVATGDDYDVMPGGLARTSVETDQLEVSLLSGEGSKDTWVVGSSPVEHTSLLPRGDESIALLRDGVDVPSRVAGNIFWFGRQLERLDAAARLVRTAISRLSGERSDDQLPELPAIYRALSELGLVRSDMMYESVPDLVPQLADALSSGLFDVRRPGTLRGIFNRLQRVATITRDRLSPDTWRSVIRIEERLHRAEKAATDPADLLDLSNALIIDVAAISGMVIESTTRTTLFAFLELGRRMERSVQGLNIIRNCLVEPEYVGGELLEVCLELSDSLMTYRSRYLARLQLEAVFDLVMTDESNPRSVAYQLADICRQVDRLPREKSASGYSSDQRLAMSMLHAVRMADVEKICDQRRLGDKAPLEKLVDEIDESLPKLNNVVAHRYLELTGKTHQLSEPEHAG